MIICQPIWPNKILKIAIWNLFLRGYCIISAYLISKDATYIWSTYSIPLPLQIYLIKISMRTMISGGKDLYKNLTNLLFSIMNLLVSFWCYSVGNEIGQRLCSILSWVSRVEIKRNIIYHSSPITIIDFLVSFAGIHNFFMEQTMNYLWVIIPRREDTPYKSDLVKIGTKNLWVPNITI